MAPFQSPKTVRGWPPLNPTIANLCEDELHALRKGLPTDFCIYSICFCFLLRLAAPAEVNEDDSLFFRSSTAAAAERKEEQTKSTDTQHCCAVPEK